MCGGTYRASVLLRNSSLSSKDICDPETCKTKKVKVCVTTQSVITVLLIVHMHDGRKFSVLEFSFGKTCVFQVLLEIDK